MNPALALSLVALAVGVGVAALSLRLGAAPGWAAYRLFALVALTAGAYCLADGLQTVALSDRWTLVAAQIQGCIAALNVAAWQAYVRCQVGAPRRWFDPPVQVFLFGCAALSLVPGVMLDGTVSEVALPWLHVTYWLPGPTMLGGALYVVEVLLLVIPVVRYARAVGLRDKRAHVLALGAIAVTAANDALAGTQLVPTPMLLSLGFLVSIAATGTLLTRAFVESVRELDRLSKRLERDVVDRTRELVTAELALLRAEKMAALGRLAAGVAHEINNPAAVVSANLAYLRDGLVRGKLPHDATECLDESLDSIDRIAGIVRQLLDSGRAAASAGDDSGVVSVARAARKALMTARPGVAKHVTTSLDIPADLFVKGGEAPLVQVLANLITNGAQAVPADRAAGHVEIRARSADGIVTIEVVDDGSGMTAETKLRLFEPFFTTKPVGQGTGLGLPVSLGLVRSMGGDLRVDSSASGTSMSVLLDAATPGRN